MGNKIIQLFLMFEIIAFQYLIVPITISQIKKPLSRSSFNEIYLILIGSIVILSIAYNFITSWLKKYYPNNKVVEYLKNKQFLDISFNFSNVVYLKKQQSINYLFIYSLLIGFTNYALNKIITLLITLENNIRQLICQIKAKR